MVVAVLAANGEVSLQYGIAEDKLRGPEIVAAIGVALDGAILVIGRLRGAAWRLGIIEESVDIEVDTQLANLAVIIGIEDMLAEFLILPDAALRMLVECAVNIVVSIKMTVEIGAWMSIVFVEGTKTVVLINHIVYLQLWRQPLPDTFRFLRVDILIIVGSHEIGEFVLL